MLHSELISLKSRAARKLKLKKCPKGASLPARGGTRCGAVEHGFN